MVFGYSVYNGRLISVNCDMECHFNKDSKCNLCSQFKENNTKTVDKIDILSPYTIDRWRELK